MFSPVQAGRDVAAQSTRSRRRQRPSSNDSLHLQPKAKRQRIPLSETTFTQPDNAAHDNPESKSTRHAKVDGIDTNGTAAAKRETLGVRSKKQKSGERATKGDGSVVLTSNHAYSVFKLPAIPDRLRTERDVPVHGTIVSSGYAVSLSHTQAFVWMYGSPQQFPECFVFALPNTSPRASDPLPLGVLVSAAGSAQEPGLVVVMPVSGKIVYWESILTAATLDMIRAQRPGVEHSIAGMVPGESVTQVLNAEPAGFVIAFSSGRLAHMNIKDSHGRPSISVQYLGSAANNGILGSIRTVFSQLAGRGEVVAVRCDRSSAKRGERIVAAVSVRAKVHAWKVQRTGAVDGWAEHDVRDALVSAIQTTDPKQLALMLPDSFEVVDFTFAPGELEAKYKSMTRLSDATGRSGDMIQQLVLLVCFRTELDCRYYICEIVVSPHSSAVGMVRPVTSYTTPPNPKATAKPRLYVPAPALVAFIVFDRAIVLASIAALPESPDVQLHGDAHILQPAFEDVVDLADNVPTEIVASGFEEPSQAVVDEPRPHRIKTRNPTVLAFVRNAGVVRVAVNDVERFASDEPPEVTARSKLEQAVMYGALDDQLLTFSGRREYHFPADEVSYAAISVSNDIISSQLPLFAGLTTSMESHIKARLNALDRLIVHLTVMHVKLDRVTRWLLLYNAEKLYVAGLLWEKHEKFTADRVSAKLDARSVVAEAIDMMRENQKGSTNSGAGDNDPVRHWFLHDISKLEIFLAWTYEVIKHLYRDGVKNDANLSRYIYETADVAVTALSNALSYRTKTAKAYGLGNEPLEHGILVSGYEKLPEPWTATTFVTNNIGRTNELCDRWLTGAESKPNLDKETLEQMRDLLPSLTDHWLVCLQEYTRWALPPGGNSAIEKSQATAKFAQQCQKAYDSRQTEIVRLVVHGLWDATLAVAEKHKTVPAMAEVMIHEVLALQDKLADASTDEKELSDAAARLKEVDLQLGEYFTHYGDVFAFAAYDLLLKQRGVEAVLGFAPDKYGHATRYLRARPGLEKISWINDIEREDDVENAAETLMELGLSTEKQVWCKKVELSLAKLALLAEVEDADRPVRAADLFNFSRGIDGQQVLDKKTRRDERIKKLDQSLEVVKIQRSLYSYVYETIQAALDEQAELQLALETHGTAVAKAHKAARQLFESSLARLLRHEALEPLVLIDLLTLIVIPQQPVVAEDHGDEEGVENGGGSGGGGGVSELPQFFQALRVANTILSGDELQNTLKLIWRRLYLRDDWAKFNQTTNRQSDQVIAETARQTVLFDTCFMVASSITDMHDKERYRPIPPSLLLGLYTHELDSRFDAKPVGQRKSLLAAMKDEDEKLKDLVTSHRLDNWVTAIFQDATRLAREELDEATKAVVV